MFGFFGKAAIFMISVEITYRGAECMQSENTLDIEIILL